MAAWQRLARGVIGNENVVMALGGGGEALAAYGIIGSRIVNGGEKRQPTISALWPASWRQRESTSASGVTYQQWRIMAVISIIGKRKISLKNGGVSA